MFALPKSSFSELYRIEVERRGHGPVASGPVILQLDELREALGADFRPGGLFGQDGLLYALAASSGDGSPRWRLAQFQANDDGIRMLGVATIPSSAERLEITPARSAWLMVENAPADDVDGDTAGAASVLVLPKSWIKDTTSSPLCTRGAERMYCAEGSEVALSRLQVRW